MSTGTDLIDMVRQLVKAENEAGEQGKGNADYILAENFKAITRMSGKEEDRGDLLKAIANPSNPNILRELNNSEFWVQESGDLGVVRSLVTTKERSNPQTVAGRFRNIHVFERQEGRWCCVAWQVTKLP